MNTTIFIAKVVNQKNTQYRVGEILWETCAPCADKAREKAFLQFHKLSEIPEIEIVLYHEGGMQKLYTLKEVSTILGVSITTINRWIESGKLPYVQIGYNQAKRVSGKDIETWIARNRKVAV